MRMRNGTRMAGLAVISAWTLGGCANLVPTQPVEFDLGQGLGEFDVQANMAVQQSRRVTLDNGGITIGRGSIEINPSAITVTPAATGGGKIQVHQQGTSTVQVTAWVGTVAELDTVFDTGDEYGPYTITLNSSNVPVSVTPATINLTGKTIGLLNDGEFSLGLEVLATIDGSVTIESLIFNLGL